MALDALMLVTEALLKVNYLNCPYFLSDFGNNRDSGINKTRAATNMQMARDRARKVHTCDNVATCHNSMYKTLPWTMGFLGMQ